jgi:hypothetical protein
MERDTNSVKFISISTTYFHQLLCRLFLLLRTSLLNSTIVGVIISRYYGDIPSNKEPVYLDCAIRVMDLSHHYNALIHSSKFEIYLSHKSQH